MKIIITALINLFFVLNVASSQDGNTPTDLTIDAASVGGVQLSWETPENFSKEVMIFIEKELASLCKGGKFIMDSIGEGPKQF